MKTSIPKRVRRPRPGPEGGRRDLNRKARLEALEQAAVPLFLAHGIEATTIDQIVARAGVGKGSFYRYHPDQESLTTALLAPLEQAVHHAFAAAESQLKRARKRGELGGAYEVLAGSLAQVALAHPDRVRLYLQECRGPAVGARRPVARLGTQIADGALRLTRAAQAAGLLRPIDPRVSSLAVIGAVERLLLAVLGGEPLGDPLVAAQALIGLVLDGVRARKT
jgi:AcrR family transcriptional regulator